MMTIATHCQLCDAKMDPGLGDGLCPACLLKEGFEEETGSAGQPDIDELNAAIEGYQFIRFLGRGGMGAVFEGKAESTGKTVAVKVLLPELAKIPTFVERLKREARTLARLAHPNIVQIFDYGQTSDFVYVVLNFIEGCTLDRYLARNTVSEQDLAKMLIQMVKGLQYAHSEGIIHRDLKPQNVLVKPNSGSLGPDVYLADFGLAMLLFDSKDQQASLTGTHQVFGTARYMSPEQLENSTKIDQRSDTFSLAVMLYEILTGKRPIGRFESPEKIALEGYSLLANTLSPFILQSLNTNPEERPEKLDGLLNDLQSVLQSNTPVKIDMKVSRRKNPKVLHREAKSKKPTPAKSATKTAIIKPENFISQMMISAVLLATTFMDWIVIPEGLPISISWLSVSKHTLLINAWQGAIPLFDVNWPVWIVPAIVWLGAFHALFGLKWPVKKSVLSFYNLTAFLCMMLVAVRITMLKDVHLGAGSLIAAAVCLLLSFIVMADTLRGITRLWSQFNKDSNSATGLRSRKLKRKLSSSDS